MSNDTISLIWGTITGLLAIGLVFVFGFLITDKGISDMNPLWFVVIINICSLFLVPFLTYLYSARNNLKLMREKWISDLRDNSAELVKVSELLFSANSAKWNFANAKQAIPLNISTAVSDGQANMSNGLAKMRLLFKTNDDDYAMIKKRMDALLSSVDVPTNTYEVLHMDPQKKYTAQDDFLMEINEVLHKHWNQISAYSLSL